MKKLIFAAALLVTTSAQAHDEIFTLLTCSPIEAKVDQNYDLELQDGGIMGRLRIVIKRHGVAGNYATETHFVRRGISLMCVGCPEVYEGEGIKLIYSPLAGKAALALKQDNFVVREELECSDVGQVQEQELL